MARETQREKILRLEQENVELKKMLQNVDKEIQKLKNENRKMKEEKKHKVISNLDIIDQQLQSARKSSDRWHDEFFKKDMEYKELKKEFQKLKAENKSVKEVHNSRGAGRKSRFTSSEIETIKMYRLQGKTIKELSNIFECSVGLVHKIINEK